MEPGRYQRQQNGPQRDPKRAKAPSKTPPVEQARKSYEKGSSCRWLLGFVFGPWGKMFKTTHVFVPLDVRGVCGRTDPYIYTYIYIYINIYICVLTFY